MSSLPAGDLHEFHNLAGELAANGEGAHQPRWYAVFTMPRHEKRLVEHCAERRIESFLPLYYVRRRWKNRSTATLDLPLFPNYLFVRIVRQDRIQVLKIPGVVSIVSYGREIAPISDNYITALRDGLLAYRIVPHPNVELGDRVTITTGPMTGMEGVLLRHKNELRVILRLEMIGRSVAVEVGADEISSIPLPALHRLPASNSDPAY
jgi:transcription antitermination factor NusG